MRADEVLALVGGDFKLSKGLSGASLGDFGSFGGVGSMANLFCEDAGLQAELSRAVLHLTDDMGRTPPSQRGGSKPPIPQATRPSYMPMLTEAMACSQPISLSAATAEAWLAQHTQIPGGLATGPLGFGSLATEPRVEWNCLARAALAAVEFTSQHHDSVHSMHLVLVGSMACCLAFT